MHGPHPRAARRALAVRVAALVGAAYTLWLFWRMSERTDALYQGGFLLAAIAVSAVIVSVVQPDRGVLGRVPLAVAAAVGRPDLLRPLPLALAGVPHAHQHAHRAATGSGCSALRLAVSVAFAARRTTLVERPIRAGTFRLPKPRRRRPGGGGLASWSRCSPPPPAGATRSPARPQRALSACEPPKPAAVGGADGPGECRDRRRRCQARPPPRRR